LWLVNRRAALSIQIATFGADWLAIDACLSIEDEITTVGDSHRDTLAILEGESRLTVLLDNAGTPSILPNEVLRTLWRLGALTASIGISLACWANWKSVNAVAILEVRVGGTLRRRGGKA
jgi:hypothetical protein